MVLQAPVVSQMVMTMVGIGIGRYINIPVIGDQTAAFTAGNGFNRVKREAPCPAKGSQGLAVERLPPGPGRHLQ